MVTYFKTESNNGLKFIQLYEENLMSKIRKRGDKWVSRVRKNKKEKYVRSTHHQEWKQK